MAGDDVLAAAGLESIARRWLRPVYPFRHRGRGRCNRVAWRQDGRRSLTRSISAAASAGIVDVARFVAAHTDPAAVILSVQHSGSLRLYADRLTLRYDALDPLWLDRVVAYLESIGRRPYYVLDGGEVDAFRQRFGAANRAGALDWPPVATLGGSIAVYDPIGRGGDASPLAIASTRAAHAFCDPPQSWPPVLRMK